MFANHWKHYRKTIHNELLVPMGQPDVLPPDHGDFEFFSDVFGMVPQLKIFSRFPKLTLDDDDDPIPPCIGT
ncbi:hypothetical protein L1987_43663 [Smallanthus sonchifolius]|uniref:Uncharacterized protein n=1 Tax=Smallanthus sonchifolius TaxID=185202 RepID=A0ACB9GME4_9ASTR|nr:hypothetical protein L1987_43663 [Smallanthus sonchifolius]